jgi:hypothetical protein
MLTADCGTLKNGALASPAPGGEPTGLKWSR